MQNTSTYVRRLGLALCLAVVFATIPLHAQDAAQVLALSVNYTTLKNTTQMTDERRKEVEAIEAKARQAAQERKYGDALGHYQHAMASLRDQAWTPARAMTAAMRLKADRLVYDPGDVAHLQITQVFVLEEPITVALHGSVAVTRAVNSDVEMIQQLRGLVDVPADFMKQPFAVDVTVPSISDGAYQLTITLMASPDQPIVKSAPIRIMRGFTAETAAVKKQVAATADRMRAAGQTDALRILAPAEYSVSLLALANNGQVSVGQLDIRAELASASSILDELAKDGNPQRSRKGDFRWAYRSGVDNELQPYRLYVPSTFDPEKSYPLIVALHGMGGDENSMFGSYGDGIIKREAESRGYIVVCPKGRGSASMYRGDAERDVMDVLSEVKRDYKIDPNRVYLMGHSMGGYGTWSIAMNHPEVFAAIAPISGGGQTAGLAKITHIPELVVHGDNDPTVNVAESRRMVETAKTLGIELRYIEVPGGTHSSVVVPHIKDVFDWFDAHKK